MPAAEQSEQSDSRISDDMLGFEEDEDVIDDADADFSEGDDFDSDALLGEDSGPAINTGEVEWCGANPACPHAFPQPA